jgi:hypothetical protein
MSTPIPKDIKLEGLELYAPRRVRTQFTSEGEAPEWQNLPQAVASDQQRAEKNRASTPDDELPKSPETRIEDAIKATAELASSLRGQEPLVSRATLPPTANPGFSQYDGAPPPFVSPRLRGYFTENEPPSRSRLDPDIVPEPPEDTRRHFVTPVVVALVVLCSAIIAYCFTSDFQLDGRQLKRESNNVSVIAPVYNEVIAEAGSPARLVAENRQAFVNEPLLLGISIDSSTGYETVMLAGLASGAQLSAGARISDASWQLSAGDVKDVYVHAPKNFVGTMNAAIELLSRDKRLVESRAVRLEWIPKPTASQPDNNSGSIRAMAPEAANLIERGRDLLRSGDVASARLLFQRLADVGIADAALALAATYDPRYLAEHNLIGVVGDAAKALGWYQRASELGSIEAGRILARTATK